MNNPLVSIIIPVYCVEKYLDRCLNSVVGQSYSNIEIIIVDDGSPDNCPKMCDEWATKDKRITAVHKQNGGLTSARKAGFDIANGDYILFIDSDDYIELNMVEEMVKKAIETDMDITLCSYSKDSSSVVPIKMSYTKDLTTKEEIRDLFILPIIRPLNDDISTNGFMVTKLLKKTIISEDLFVSEREYYTEDIIFNAKLALKVNGIAIVNEPLYHYCENRESLTFKYREGKFEMWNKRTDYFENYFRENGWLELAQNRIIVMDLTALLIGADNEVLKNDREDFKKKCKYMKKVVKQRGYFNIINLKYLNNAQKVVFIMYYFGAYNTLFSYRKKRLNLS